MTRPELLRWPVYILLPLAGWFGAQILSPGTRITRLEAQVHAVDSTHLVEMQRLASVLETHLVWAQAERSKLQDYIEAIARFQCLQNDNVGGHRLMLAAKIPCGTLLGNAVPGQ